MIPTPTRAETPQSKTGKKRARANLVLSEEEMTPFPIEECRGVLAAEELDRREVTGFWLKHEYHVDVNVGQQIPVSCDCCVGRSGPMVKQPRRVFLFLAGGGYVTGYPLVHPFIFSLLRSLAPSPASHPTSDCYDHVHSLPQYAVLAPHVRKSLSLDRAFPIPLLDALAGYAHLRNIGYAAEEVVVIGDSAGGGLAWSLVAYLAALDGELGAKEGGLGVPGGLAMISVSWIRLIALREKKHG